MQSITAVGTSPEDPDEGGFGPGMALIARADGQSWSRGTRGVICARRVAELLPPIGGVTLYVVLFETGLQAELSAHDLRRSFMVSLVVHPGFGKYAFETTRNLHVDFHNGRFIGVFGRKREA